MNTGSSDSRVLWPMIALAALGVVGTWAIVNWPVPLLAVGPTLLWFGRRMIPPSLVSPVWLITGFLTLTGAAGYAVYGTGPQAAELLFVIDPEVARDTVVLFSASTTLLVCGALLYCSLQPSVGGTARLSAPRVSSRTILTISFVAYLPIVAGLVGVDNLLSRANYIENTNQGTFFGALGVVTLIGIVALGFLLRQQRGGYRLIPAAAFALELTILFSLGSRQFALAPLALALGAYLFRPDRTGRNLLILATVVSVLLLPIPLHLRGLSSHGFVNYFPELSSVSYGWSAIRESIGNVTQGFPVTGLTAYRSSEVGLDKVLISINPAPGSIAGWYDINSQLRLGKYFPFSGIGELWSSGAMTASVLFFLAGVAIGHFDRRIRELVIGGRQVAALAIFGMVVLSGILLTQYNLRNATRPLWYAAAIDIATRVSLAGGNSPGKDRGRIRISPRGSAGRPRRTP